ncbi:MAG: EAL domain-containing protein, partial [Lachnospiraceae bacterium]|nr:EAL domain-containing protein [Lachnospiraceae bacterium]
ELEKIDKDHVFSFHAGVYIIEVQRDANGRVVRRKDVDIESDYNNAVTAVSTLEGNDSSGVLFFDNRLYEEHKWESIVTEQEKKALDNKEFLVYYQPKYDPKTDRLKGAEALIRWNSPEFGLVSPGRFIPIFEKNGFIKEIDHYMLRSVAADQKRWFDEGRKCVPISVNVSRAHFIESDLAEQIRDTVDREGTSRSLIEIELTESAFFDDKDALISIIEKLKEYGFSVSMDDFGSGYSSLNSLKDMPLDVLKLDAEFFRGGDKERGEKVVSETIKLAKSLKMKTVAEGVEIKDQVEFLAEQGCDMIQGYYYAKPMPKNEFEERMEIVE